MDRRTGIGKKNEDRPYGQSSSLVGVSGFEPEASWTRTKRDTKLRHTPIARNIIVKKEVIVKGKPVYLQVTWMFYVPHRVQWRD